MNIREDKELDLGEFRGIVADMEVTARGAHATLRSELLAGPSEPPVTAGDVEVERLRRSVATTRRELRRLEQYLVALEAAEGS